MTDHLLPTTPDPKRVRISISYIPPSAEIPRGYLGATSSYEPLPGEDWRRGTDLTDGPANAATLVEIMQDIEAIMCGFPRAYEMDLAKHLPPPPTPDFGA